MKDNQFGELTRGRNNTWETAVLIPFFRGFGGSLEEDAADADQASPPAAPRPRRTTKRQVEAAKALNAFAQTVRGEERQVLEAAMRMVEKAAAGELPPPETLQKKRDDDAGPAGPLDCDSLFRQGKFCLSFDPGRNGPPTPAQRAAWDALVARGDKVWAGVVDALFAEYRLQRPVRARWWKATFGERGLREALPEVLDAAGLKKLLRPLDFRVLRPGEGAAAAHDVRIGILWGCTWNRDGLAVILQGHRPVEVGRTEILHAPVPRMLLHPTFGTLRWIEAGNSWAGFTRCEPFAEFCQVSGTRAKYRSDPGDFGQPRSEIAWEFARGEFEISVYAPGGGDPTDAQAKAWQAFRKNDAKSVAGIVAAIFDRYQKSHERIRRNWQDEFVDELVPALKSPDGLRELIQMREVHVFPESEGGGVTIAFQFVCTWDYDGVSVHWRDGKVIGLGTWDDARPTEAELSSAAARAPASRPNAVTTEKKKQKDRVRTGRASPPASASSASATPPPVVTEGPVRYELKLTAKPGPTGSAPAALTSPMLDPVMYNPGPLTVHLDVRGGAPGAAPEAIEPFEEASLFYFLRNQSGVRRLLEAELAKDLDRYDPDGSFGRDDVWGLARVQVIVLEPRRVITQDNVARFAAGVFRNVSEDVLKDMSAGGDTPDTRATFILVLKVEWHDEYRMVTIRDGRVAEFRVGY